MADDLFVFRASISHHPPHRIGSMSGLVEKLEAASDPMPFVCLHGDPRCEDDPCPWGIARVLCNAPADHPARALNLNETRHAEDGQVLGFSRRCSSASTASRTSLDRPYLPTAASMRASSSGVICTFTGTVPLGPIGGLPMGLALSGGIEEGNDKTAPFSVDGINGGVYINHTVYGDNPMTFQLDTTGYVLMPDPEQIEGCTRWVSWSDLSSFAQGYIEALFVSLREDDLGYLTLAAIKDLLRFDKLAPETLARIVSDCIAIRAANRLLRDTKHDGRAVWEARQSGAYRQKFPPVKVVNGDGDRVVFQ